MTGGEALTWRDVVDKHSAALVDELARRLDSDLEAARAETAAAERAQAALNAAAARVQALREAALSTAESLNQTMRRIRQAPSQAEVLAVLLEGAALYAGYAVVLRVENNQVRSLGTRGGQGTDGPFEFPLDAAPAIASVCENRDPVVALASPAELTAELASALGEVVSHGDGATKAYLFPIAVRLEVMAVLIAGGEPVSAALELLAGAAGMRLEALDPAIPASLTRLPSPELVQISAPAVSQSAESETTAWEKLSPEDQRLHLQAQRVARVKVAEMRIYHADELRKGVFDGDIYSALKNEIDGARESFLKTFLAKSATMVDYLHLELLRSLAHEDDRLLGPGYPGPMV
jgi:hypothetical protein